jgi:glycosyltransferase involved in cell wall biosynthesis
VLPKDAVIGLFLGRFHPVKNLDVLFEGVRRLVVTDRWNPRARIVCVGRAEDQAYVDRLQAFINIHHLGDIIHLTAARREVLPLYRACDFLLVVSHHEGLPVVVLEAGAAGRPAVVSQAANSDEIVLDGQSGWIVPTGDAEALASRLEQVIQLPTAERDRMGLAAREHIQRRFDIRQSAQQYLRVYHNLLERGG